MANHNKIVTLLVLEAVFVIQDTLNKGRSLSAEIVIVSDCGWAISPC